MLIKRLNFIIMLAACLLAPVSQAATVDGDPGFNLGSDTGVYVWRDSSGVWQLRLVSARIRQEFSGTFTSSQSITQVSNVLLEGHDNVSLTSNNTLTVDLFVYKKGLDGVSFTTAQNANLCLRDSSGARRTVYLGANAVAAATPVDLTGTGACGKSTSASTDDGLQITRLSAQDWQVRLVSTNNAFQFEGTFDATQNFSWYQPVALETSDSVNYTGQDVLNVSFATWPGGSDGVNFSLSDLAGICLRESSGSGVPVYLNNMPVSFPVDLTGSGACSDSASGGSTSGDGTASDVSDAANAGASVNTAPALTGTPQAVITVGGEYSFNPVAFDADGNTLIFDIQNGPGWLAFNAADGSLSGTPTVSDIGTDDNIVITVSDGTDTASIGPFSIVINDVAAVQTQTKKYNPGHYIDLLRYMTASDWSDNYITDTMRAGVTGVQVRYYWRDLETAPGVYDFSRIQHDLDLLSSQGLHLIVNPADKTFREAQPVPDYLSGYVLLNNNGGYTVERWKPYVIDRWVKLMQALGQRFDSNPYFEGVATEESALSLDEAVLTDNGYTPENYRDGLIDMLRRTAEAFPTSRTFWYMNFFPMRQDYIAQVASAVAPFGVAMGGPDILPDNSSISKLAYPFYDQFQGTMPLFCVAMPDSYKHAHKDTSYPTQYWTMQELFEFARDKLHLNYMLWTSVPDSSSGYDTYDAYPVIERNPAFNL